MNALQLLNGACGRAFHLLAAGLVLATSLLQAAPSIPNPSFETDHFNSPIAPYIQYNTPITGWTVADADKEYVGLNPSNGTHDFANNGATPDGTNVAFIQCRPGHGRVALSTTITGLTAGTSYRLQFRANARVGGTPFATYRINGGAEINFSVNPVDSNGSFTNPYLIIGSDFTATGTTATLELANNTADDSSLLVDAFTLSAGPIVVTSTGDSGPGTLRDAFAIAAANPGPDVITFDPSLTGSITLADRITVSDTGGVTVGGATGATITSSGSNRLFDIGTGSVCTMTGLTLTGAHTNGDGGAIYNAGGTLTLNQCTLSNNNATASAGAVANTGNLVCTQCTFASNSCASVGGALYNVGTLTLDKCTLLSNSSPTGFAGAVVNYGSLVCTQSTFASNSCSGDGGAFYNGSGHTAQLTHCTLALNHAGDYGGGFLNNTSGILTFTNCIIAKNTASGSSLTNDGYNLSTQWTLQGTNLILAFGTTEYFSGPQPLAADPKLGPLQNNGGPTQTMALLSGSAAVDVDPTPVTTDQRGFPGVGRADLGAFEMQAGGSFSLSASTYKALEGYPLLVTINRTGPNIAGSATIRLLTTPGTASAADFTARPDDVTSDVTFAGGETSQDVLIYPTKDTLVEKDETFTLTLAQPRPAGLITLGATPTAVVTISTTAPFQVTNTNDDGPGSLRQTLAAAAALPGYNAVTFALSLNGKTITLGSEIFINDAGGVMVDASSLPAGLTLDGNGTSRIFRNPSGSRLDLRRLTLTQGNGVGSGSSGNGGALFTSGKACLFQCTLSGNSVQYQAGAIQTGLGSVLFLVQCTLSGNQCGSLGGAVMNLGKASFIHCTVTGNTSPFTDTFNYPVIGGGIYSDSYFSVSYLTLENTIVAGNTAVTAPDVGLGDGATRLRLNGFNFARYLYNPYNAAIDGPNDPLLNDPRLGPLAANGGPTKTHALLAGSLAINNALGSTVTTDQRGLPIVGTADIGAFEAQPGGVFAMSSTHYTVLEAGGHVPVTIMRGGALFGSASVKITATPGTAKASDFTPASRVVTFAAGESSKDVDFDVLNDTLVEPNETFTVSLSNPSVGCTIGTPSSAKVVIIDPSASVADHIGFGTPVITNPAANATVGVDVGGTLTLTGTATDNNGVSAVFIFSGIDSQTVLTQAYLETPGAPSSKWTAYVTPVAGTNTYRAQTANLIAGTHASALSATLTVKVLRPLGVNISGFGNVNAGYAPRSFREVGKPVTLTASPGAGAIFKGWTLLSTHTPADIGITTAALNLPTFTFIHREGLMLRASFVASPYTSTVVGTFNGGIIPTSVINLSTQGAVSLTVQSNGAFSGSLKLDGTSYPVAGTFDYQGTARFGPARTIALTVPRKNLPGMTLGLSTTLATPYNGRITGSLAVSDGLNVYTSAVHADRASYSLANPVPNTLLTPYLNSNGSDGTYTARIDAATPPPGFPNGSSIATVKVSKAGQVTAVYKLSDGTTGTASTTLANGAWYFFAPLYANQGFIAGEASFVFSSTTSDFFAPIVNWLRPIQDSQYYPAGWPGGVTVEMAGAKYQATPGSSILPGLAAIPANPGPGYTGNATLGITLSPPASPSSLGKTVAITPADLATPAPADASFNLKIDRTTGLFNGTFTHPDGTKPAYQGIMYRKGPGNGGYGFYLTVPPKVKDYTGFSGRVTLTGQ